MEFPVDFYTVSAEYGPFSFRFERVGPTHEPNYICTAELHGNRFTGTGRRKRLAEMNTIQQIHEFYRQKKKICSTYNLLR